MKHQDIIDEIFNKLHDQNKMEYLDIRGLNRISDTNIYLILL
jgi:hypothetical protein